MSAKRHCSVDFLTYESERDNGKIECSTYDKLIKTAIMVMSEVGYKGMSIGILADMVGISKSTVIHYFKSKEGILLAVMENFLPAYIDEFKPVLNNKSLDGVTKLNKFVHFHMKMVAERKDVLSINIKDGKFLTGKSRTVYQQQQRLYGQQVVRIIQQIQSEETNLFKDLDPHVTAKAIMGMCNHACVWYKKNDILTGR
ncbi:transcriptional regulator, TetR family [Geobacter metallireducens GS-15]|uniref:Transcriptional regulator, TetR family n=1 Tax=Geobacter metallireducens (strain ATCC 53774 / DSM 7210 / GS-15) TaxID=269799 RepID=Q39TF6_GEOMG|nr:TetR family transcriptional regulator [Geobacter metallireducens]ABB32468.1 transcriptional regulator, TetR family [Geobacter metallireducens GS-15]